MKIPVREVKPKLQIEIQERSGELELFVAHLLLMRAAEEAGAEEKTDGTEAQAEPAAKKPLDWRQIFSLLPIALQDKQPADGAQDAEGKGAARTVEIKFELPSLDTVKQKALEFKGQLRNIPKKYAFAGAGGAIVLAALLVWFITRPAGTAANNGGIQAPVLHHGTPNYATILPAGENINQLGGWVRISPPNRSPVYTYLDHINGVQVNVSEQPLPAKLQNDATLYQLAQNFGAENKLDAGGTMFYIGTGAEDAQSVIFAKDNLLILMKSVQIVPTDKWIGYISSMK